MVTSVKGNAGVPRRSPFGHLTVTGQAGDTIRIEASSLYVKGGQMDQGLYAQLVGGANVSIQATLSPPDIAINPDMDTANQWNAAQILTTSAITKITNPATALLVTFTAAGTLYLIGV